MLVHILIIVICYIREKVNNKQRYVLNPCIMTILSSSCLVFILLLSKVSEIDSVSDPMSLESSSTFV